MAIPADNILEQRISTLQKEILDKDIEINDLETEITELKAKYAAAQKAGPAGDSLLQPLTDAIADKQSEHDLALTLFKSLTAELGKMVKESGALKEKPENQLGTVAANAAAPKPAPVTSLESMEKQEKDLHTEVERLRAIMLEAVQKGDSQKHLATQRIFQIENTKLKALRAEIITLKGAKPQTANVMTLSQVPTHAPQKPEALDAKHGSERKEIAAAIAVGAAAAGPTGAIAQPTQGFKPALIFGAAAKPAAKNDIDVKKMMDDHQLSKYAKEIVTQTVQAAAPLRQYIQQGKLAGVEVRLAVNEDNAELHLPTLGFSCQDNKKAKELFDFLRIEIGAEPIHDGKGAWVGTPNTKDRKFDWTGTNFTLKPALRTEAIQEARAGGHKVKIGYSAYTLLLAVPEILKFFDYDSVKSVKEEQLVAGQLAMMQYDRKEYAEGKNRDKEEEIEYMNYGRLFELLEETKPAMGAKPNK